MLSGLVVYLSVVSAVFEVGNIYADAPNQGVGVFPVALRRSFSQPVVLLQRLTSFVNSFNVLGYQRTSASSFNLRVTQLGEWGARDDSDIYTYFVTEAGRTILSDGSHYEAGIAVVQPGTNTVTVQLSSNPRNLNAFQAFVTLVANDDSQLLQNFVPRVININSAQGTFVISLQVNAGAVTSPVSVAFLAIELNTGASGLFQVQTVTAGTNPVIVRHRGDLGIHFLACVQSSNIPNVVQADFEIVRPRVGPIVAGAAGPPEFQVRTQLVNNGASAQTEVIAFFVIPQVSPQTNAVAQLAESSLYFTHGTSRDAIAGTIQLYRTFTQPVVIMQGYATTPTTDFNNVNLGNLDVMINPILIQPNRIDFQVREPQGNNDGIRVNIELIQALVVEAGSFTLSDGSVVQAGQAVITSTSQTITFPRAFSQVPVVVPQVVQASNFSTVRVLGVTTTTVVFLIERERSQVGSQSPLSVQVHWVAFQSPSDVQASNFFSLQRITATSVPAPINAVPLNGTYFFGSVNSLNENDPVQIEFSLIRTLTSTRASVCLAEDTSVAGVPRTHGTEDVSVVVARPGQTWALAVPPPSPRGLTSSQIQIIAGTLGGFFGLILLIICCCCLAKRLPDMMDLGTNSRAGATRNQLSRFR